MSDLGQAAYAAQEAAQRKYAEAGVVQAVDERITTRIRQRAQTHAAVVNELSAGVEQLANGLFGHMPTPPNAPTTKGSDLGRVEPVRSQMDAIDHAQYLLDEALESLRRQLSRLAPL